MINHEYYTYQIIWSVEDEEFVGLCAEYPSLSYLHKNRCQALAGITNLVKEVVADMEKSGEEIPEPISQISYSSKS